MARYILVEKDNPKVRIGKKVFYTAEAAYNYAAMCGNENTTVKQLKDKNYERI